MNICIVELTTTPADEHLNEQGFAVRVEISFDESGCKAATYRRRTTYPMGWLEDRADPAIWAEPRRQLSEDVAASILALIRSTRIGPAVEEMHGYVHATKFELAVSSVFFSCSFSWFAELPTEWSALQQTVNILGSIGGTGTESE
jgi:hypothetical protein